MHAISIKMGNFCQQVLKPLGSYTHIADNNNYNNNNVHFLIILHSLTIIYCTETDTLGIYYTLYFINILIWKSCN